MLGRLRLVIAARELAQRDRETGDLLLADLHAAPEAVVRRLGRLALDPRLDVDVHVERLQADGLDQLAAAGEHAGSLRAADRLAAAEDDERRALVDEPAEVRRRRQLGRGVDDHGYAVRRGELADAAQRNAVRVGERELADRDGVLRERRLELPFVRQADAFDPRVADLDDPGAGGSEGPVVGVAMASLHDDLRGHPGRVREGVHGREARPRDARRRGERHSGRGAGRHPPGLGARQLGDRLARPRLQVVGTPRAPGGLVHRRADRRGEGAAAERGDEAGGADHARDRDQAHPALAIASASRLCFVCG